MSESTRQLVAIMFTDIVGYTALMGDEEEKAFDLLERNRKLQKPLIESYGGKWIKELGDGVLATFSTVSDAVYCAAAIQQQSKNEPDLNLCIGIHQGEVVFQDDDVFGDGVNIASRLESLAPAGGIWVSEAVSRNIQNKHGIQTLFVRKEQLKNVKEPVKIYVINAEDVELPEHVDHLKEPPAKSKPSTKGIYLALALVLIAVLVYWSYTKFVKAESVTIAVLAFDDQSPNGDQEWLGDGMADEILNVLAKVNGLQVTGKTSSFSFKGKGLTTKVIGETLNVSTVLEGSVSKIGDKLRITAQLIDVETDTHIWSKKYDRDAADIFAIVDEVAQSITNSLRTELSLEELDELRVGHEVDPEAYDYYLKGIHLANNYWSTFSEVDFEDAENMLTKAITTDPGYAEAYAALADLYDNGLNKSKRDSISDIGYKINPNSAFVVVTRGFRFKNSGSLEDVDSAFYYYKIAYEIDPRSIPVLENTIVLLNAVGLYNEAIEISRRILENDPLNTFVMNQLASSLLSIGNFDLAKLNYKKTLELDRDHILANRALFYLAVFADRNLSEAKQLSEQLKSIYPNMNYSYHDAWFLALEGKSNEALDIGFNFSLYSLLCMKKELIKSIQQADSTDKNSYKGTWAYLRFKNGLTYRCIRDEPVFQAQLAKAKKVHDERVTKYGHLFDE